MSNKPKKPHPLDALKSNIEGPKPLDQFFEENKGQLPNLPAKMKRKLLNDAKFLSEHGFTTETPEIATKTKTTKKKAYPNFNQYTYVSPQRDVSKWIQAARDLYYQTYKGADHKTALDQVTSSMDPMEKLDFERWLRFYQEGTQHKYKTAQVRYWENANQPGYFVPVRPDQQAAQETQVSNTISQMQNPATHPDIDADNKRDAIERQRSKIIGRLDSAEKLMRSREGVMFAGPELETLLDIIYQLKKKIQMVNKLSSSTRLYEDMIIREANVLNHRGFVKGAMFLSSLAQAMPNPAEAKNPLDNSGMPGNWPGEGPGMTPEQVGPNDTMAPPDPSASAAPLPSPPGHEAGKGTGPNGETAGQLPTPSSTSPDAFPGDGLHLPGEVVSKPLSEGMKGFLQGLDAGTNALDMADSEDDQVIDIHEASLHEMGFVIEAQDAAPITPELEMTEQQVDPEVAAGKDFDSMVDSAFSGVTVQDAVDKLEDVAKIFKVREISRQLSLVDLMLNQLGLAAMFPSLGEAINKSLESNQYIATRIDDILARLQGSLASNNVDLQGSQPEANPQAQQVKEQLVQEDAKEKAQKKMRKDLENRNMSPEKPVPSVEIAQDLQQPTQLPPTAPVPAPVR